MDIAGKQVDFDSRPSDAFALAVRAKAPIFFEESVLERAGVSLDTNEGPQQGTTETKQKQEKEQVVVDAFSNEMTLLRKENETLKEQLAQLQNELASAQKRITELESEDLPPSTNAR